MPLRAGLLLAALLVSAECRAQDDLLRRGELIAAIGGCGNCHSAKNGPPLAGGDALATPFGVFYAPNITSDPETGIGGWTTADLARALHEGRAPDGTVYYPAFPYTSYTRMTEDDVAALKAWLDTVPAVRHEGQPHALTFPYDQRWALWFWQMVFFEPERFEPDPGQAEAWNRGAYLVEGPGHCGECHTPRNFAGATNHARAYAGAPAPTGRGRIPNISGDPADGLGRWGETEIVTVLGLGMKPDGDFLGGEMAKVVEHGTGRLPQADVRAIAFYLKSLTPTR